MTIKPLYLFLSQIAAPCVMCVALIPDLEVHDTVIRIFGPRSHPLYKLWRMNYWMPKFKNLSPWLLPDPVPDESLQLAKLAIRQMCTVDVESAIDVLDTSQVTDAIDKTWIVSGQSPEQKKLLRRHPPANALRIEGPHFIWLRNRSLDYFTLTGEAEPDEHFEQATDPDGEFPLSSGQFTNRTTNQTRSTARFRCSRYSDARFPAICGHASRCGHDKAKAIDPSAGRWNGLRHMCDWNVVEGLVAVVDPIAAGEGKPDLRKYAGAVQVPIDGGNGRERISHHRH